MEWVWVGTIWHGTLVPHKTQIPLTVPPFLCNLRVNETIQFIINDFYDESLLALVPIHHFGHVSVPSPRNRLAAEAAAAAFGHVNRTAMD